MFTNVLNDRFGEILKRVNPAERRKLSRSIAVAVRAERSNEILANKNADGTAMEKRKAQKASRRRSKNKSGKMFKKLGKRSSLRIHANASFAAVSFQHKNRKIAENHQYGRKVQINRYTKVKYPKRSLLGIGPKEEQIVLDQLMKLMEGAL